MTKRTITKEEAIKLVNQKLSESGFDLNLKDEDIKKVLTDFRFSKKFDLEITKQQIKLFKELKLEIDVRLYPFEEKGNFDFSKISGFRIDFDYDYIHPRGSNGYVSRVLYNAEYDEYSEG